VKKDSRETDNLNKNVSSALSEFINKCLVLVMLFVVWANVSDTSKLTQMPGVLVSEELVHP